MVVLAIALALAQMAAAPGGWKDQKHLAVFRTLALVDGEREAELVRGQRIGREEQKRSVAGKNDAQAPVREAQRQAAQKPAEPGKRRLPVVGNEQSAA